MLDPKVAVGPRKARSASISNAESRPPGESHAPDSDGPDFARILCATATFPHRRAHVRPSGRVMDQVQIDVVESGLLQRSVDALFHPGGVGPVVHELGGERDFGPRGARLGDKVVDGAATVGFVLVPFGACFICMCFFRGPSVSWCSLASVGRLDYASDHRYAREHGGHAGVSKRGRDPACCASERTRYPA
jgi:hypothetical protein